MAETSLFSRVPYYVTAVIYFMLNATLGLLNRWSLGVYGMHLPIFITLCHLSACFVMLLPLVLLNKTAQQTPHAELWKKRWKGFVAVGVLMAANLGFQNASLAQMQLSLNQVVRSCIPAITVVAGSLLDGHLPTKLEGTSLLVLSTGVFFACTDAMAQGLRAGVALCLLGSGTNAALLLLTTRLLPEKLDVVSFTFYTSPVSLATLIPFFLWLELGRLRDYLLTHNAALAGILLAGCATAVAYNAVHSVMMTQSSATANMLVSEAKILGLVAIACVVLQEWSIYTPKTIVGSVLALAGFVAYSHIQLYRRLLADKGTAAAAAAGRPLNFGGTLNADPEVQDPLLPRKQPAPR